MTRLIYDAVIATRNRPDALCRSIPALIFQSHPPSRLIVVDSSDDHAAVRRTVDRLVEGWPGEVLCVQSPPGLPRQRNLGLRLVTAPVVLFPDDDSLLYPAAAAKMMAIYQRDTEGHVAGVCASEAALPPPTPVRSVPGGPGRDRRRTIGLKWLRSRCECLVPGLKPAQWLGKVLNARHAVPGWFAELDVVPVSYMTGYRMSFRTDVIRATGFDETLAGYALEEDVDASLSAMRSGLVVGARQARIFHDRAVGARGNAFELGRMEVWNRAHVLIKHTEGRADLRRAVRRAHAVFTIVKLGLCLLGASYPEGRARLRGAWRGHRDSVGLWAVRPEPRRAAVLGVRH